MLDTLFLSLPIGSTLNWWVFEVEKSEKLLGINFISILWVPADNLDKVCLDEPSKLTTKVIPMCELYLEVTHMVWMNHHYPVYTEKFHQPLAQY